MARSLLCGHSNIHRSRTSSKVRVRFVSKTAFVDANQGSITGTPLRRYSSGPPLIRGLEEPRSNILLFTQVHPLCHSGRVLDTIWIHHALHPTRIQNSNDRARLTLRYVLHNSYSTLLPWGSSRFVGAFSALTLFDTRPARVGRRNSGQCSGALASRTSWC